MENSVICSECGKEFPSTEIITYQNVNVCAACKPTLIQKIKEGVTITGAMNYGGFWIRFGAKFIDWMILWVINMCANFIFAGISTFSTDPTTGLGPAFWLYLIFSYSLGIFYHTWFLGKFAATPGKMACGLKVIMSDGNKIRYGRAFGRYFAEILSSLIFSIGYIMAAFDDEKRTLHDRICNTRVVLK